MVICLERGADLHTVQLMPLPLTVSCFSKIQIGFTFLVLAHLGSPGQRALNWCVCVRACVCVRVCVSRTLITSGDVLNVYVVIVEMHVHLYNNIVLSGGSCLFPGFKQRLYVLVYTR